jgi:hypothetical protein
MPQAVSSLWSRVVALHAALLMRLRIVLAAERALWSRWTVASNANPCKLTQDDSLPCCPIRTARWIIGPHIRPLFYKQFFSFSWCPVRTECRMMAWHSTPSMP